MYRIGDYIVKSMSGVCRIEDITRLDIPGTDKDRMYYLLIPIEDAAGRIYAPTDTIDATTRTVMTKEEALKLIDKIPELEEQWISNDKLRQERYKEVVRQGDPESLVGIMKMAYNWKIKRLSQGKKNTAIDERYFHVAENNLYSELGFALQKTKEEICNLIAESISSKTMAENKM